MTFLRKHGGFVTVFAAAAALVFMGGAIWNMAAKPVLGLQKMGGESSALDSVVVTGLFGDGTNRMEFTIQDGVLTQRFHPSGIDYYENTVNRENNMADYQPSEGDAWYQSKLELLPESGVQSVYEETLETSEDGAAWYHVRRITTCESVRVWAGVTRCRMLISGRIPDDYRLKAMTRTDIVLDMAELSARMGKKLALVQNGGSYGVIVNSDGTYEKPYYSKEDFSWQSYQLWDLENDCAVDLPASSGEMNAAVLDGQAYFVPDTGNLWHGETAIYRVTGYDDWLLTFAREREPLEWGSAEKAVPFQLEEGWRIRALYALEDGQLALVQTSGEELRIRLFSAATGEELDRRDFAGQGVDFDSLDLTSYVQQDGAVLDFRKENTGWLWCGGFVIKDRRIIPARSFQQGPASSLWMPERPLAAAVVNGNLPLFRVPASEGGEDWYELLLLGDAGADESWRITAPLLQDQFAQQQGMSVPVRGISGVKIEGREQS